MLKKFENYINDNTNDKTYVYNGIIYKTPIVHKIYEKDAKYDKSDTSEKYRFWKKHCWNVFKLIEKDLNKYQLFLYYMYDTDDNPEYVVTLIGLKKDVIKYAKENVL